MKSTVIRSDAVVIAGAFAVCFLALANMPAARAQSAELHKQFN
jgi:hypothetical protein